MKLKHYFGYLIKHLLDIPISVYVNLKLFPINEAIKFPVFVSRNIVVKNLKKNSIKIEGKLEPFLVTIGIGGVDGISEVRKGLLQFGSSGQIFFKGKAQLSKGVALRVSTGKLVFGKNFYSNCNLTVICSEEVEFGDNCLLGWNVHIRDCDGHSIYQNNELINNRRKVTIYNHVWIGQDVKVLKGSIIPNDSIIAMNSCVTKAFTVENTIIGGYPAVVIKRNVSWEV